MASTTLAARAASRARALWARDPRLLLAAVSAWATLAAAALWPRPALAIGINDIVDKIGDVLNKAAEVVSSAAVPAIVKMMCGWVADIAQVMPGYMDSMATISKGGYGSFSTTGDATLDAGIGLLNTVNSVVLGAGDAVKVLAYSLLAVAFCIKFLKVIKEPDNGPAGIPYLEKYAWLWITFAIMKELLDYSSDISAELFNAFQAMSAALGGVASPDIDYAAWQNDVADSIGHADFSSMGSIVSTSLSAILLTGLVLLGIICCAVAAIAMTYARWVEVFISMIFAPLAFSMIGLEETRGVVVGYLKKLLSMSLAFFVTILMMQVLVSAFLPFAVETLRHAGSISLMNVLVVLAIGLAIIHIIMHAGSFARELIG